MADPLDTVEFRSLVTQSSAVLLTHGVEVEVTSVHRVASNLVEVIAQQSGMDRAEAVHPVTPEAVAGIIMEVAAEEDRSSPGPHATRPVRLDDRSVRTPVESLGHLVMAAARAGKYAGINDDGAAAAHLLDLATEIGAALVQRHSDGAANVPVGMLDELTELVDAVADHIESGNWSICTCGEDHEQGDVDSDALPVMRHQAALARRLRAQATG
ncbi:hypothetical protein [Streptomyces sp. VRA16 Mangrove soil]|uniref:hypothetical protein n=1 Tax=Streptomyces sp. VRA16 Mangrove soil TaxID=2817434 RepID=UPI001A9FF199|nr:hypothetical protein [Streptomyces sp. VRA16 Mangrove soil]MBO1333813.1 hypothetical protein [Streptomyces sp. VRA16 Mangrove soil]